MKKYALAAIAAILVVPVIAGAQAQGGQKGGAQGGAVRGGAQGGQNAQDFQKRMQERQKQQRDKVVKDLKLNADQTKKYDALLKKTQEKRTKLFGTGRPDPAKREAMQKSMQKINDEHNAELKKIFTAAQMTQYTKMMEQMRQQRRQGGGAQGGAAGNRTRGGAAGGGGTKAGGGKG